MEPLTNPPEEFRLTDAEAADLAQMIRVGAATGQIALVYCRDIPTGELHPILAAVTGMTEEGFNLAPFARVITPRESARYAPPTDADNPQPDTEPHVYVPATPELFIPGR